MSLKYLTLHVLLQQAVHPSLEVGEVLRFGQVLDPVDDVGELRVHIIAFLLDKVLHGLVLGLDHLVAFPYRIKGSPDPRLVLLLFRLLENRPIFGLWPLRLWTDRSRTDRSKAYRSGAHRSGAQRSPSLRARPTPLSS